MAEREAPENLCAWTVSGLAVLLLARCFAAVALRQHLRGDALLRAEPVRVHSVDRHRVAGLEAGLEVADVEDLRVRAERLERHPPLHVRPAQLAHPHVDRHLAALEVRARLRPRAGAV